MPIAGYDQVAAATRAAVPKQGAPMRRSDETNPKVVAAAQQRRMARARRGQSVARAREAAARAEESAAKSRTMLRRRRPKAQGATGSPEHRAHGAAVKARRMAQGLDDPKTGRPRRKTPTMAYTRRGR